jgi:hypothetical protein
MQEHVGGARERLHRWVPATPLVRWEHCGDCGIIKRRDGRNSPNCKGPPRVGPRATDPTPAEPR